jgi:hypothetical protein
MLDADYKALCADIVRASDAVSHDAAAAEGDFLAAIDNARAALDHPEPVLTIQECNNMHKHGENYMYESRDGKEIQLDGWFTRADLIELAHTKPTIH